MDEDKPATVMMATSSPQGGDIRKRWEWVEHCVWTEAMLRTLEEGVKGGKWFRLFDKVYAQRTMQEAVLDVLRNGGAGGVDGQSVAQFEKECEEELKALAEELHQKSYRPQPVRRVWIAKSGSREKRPLGIPAVRDRVVQTALRKVIEPIFEREFAEQSYGFRPGRGCKDALRRVDQLLREGYTWVVEADLKSYFETIPQERLMERVRERIADGPVLKLVEGFLKQGVLEELKGWQPTESGTPQGAVISPLLANLYLNPLDHQMARGGQQMVRYADDFVILSRTQAEAQAVLEAVVQWANAEGLELHAEKTRVVDVTQPGGFDFLGYHFELGNRWPRKKSLDKFKDKVREITRRVAGQSLMAIISAINRKMRGWFEYFKHSHWTTFRPLDQWIRMRLRSILRKRQGRKGRGRGKDHQRWPNAYFDGLGLVSLGQAHNQISQSR